MKKIAFLMFVIFVAITGCRREDIREVAISLPEVTSNDTAKIVSALSVYSGIDKSSLKWDFDAKTLSLRYDSMQIAQTNIRMAIEKVGVKVVYPKNTTGRAGY